MDSGIVIVGTILLALCIVPFVILHYNSKKKEKQMLQSLTEIAQQHNCKMTQHEFCGEFVIGLDENKNFAFFFRQKKEEAISRFVDLSEIQTCQVVKKNRNSKNNNGGFAFTERIELNFIPTHKSKEEIRFEMYDAEANMQLNGELQLADKWSKQINDRLKNNKERDIALQSDYRICL
jgi:hypothetical protein